MNKFTYALALGAGLVLSLAAPSVHASAVQSSPIQDLTPTSLSAAQFNSDFTPITGVSTLSQPFTFLNTNGTAGTVQSQVFQGQGAYAGIYAYAYQIDVNNTKDSTGQPIGVNSTAMYFNATPAVEALVSGSPSAVYSVNGAIGGLNAPTAGGGGTAATPSHVFWQPGTSTGSLTFQYLDANSNAGPLMGGTNSATMVVLSTQPPSSSQLYVSLQSPDPQNGYPQVYSPQTGTIAEVPAPEPATIIGWTGVIGALALVHRVRRNRLQPA
ncbi:MAG TPA: hypothetical protein VFF52_04930 [Isosphaeraceae bacterium]|nr:hypothetical protein [Isosphaeraceae bacterium]